MAATTAAANTSRWSIEADGGGVGPVGGGMAMACARTYGEVAGKLRLLCICMRIARFYANMALV